jgi:membrane protease YdiL (CAAX protease family)
MLITSPIMELNEIIDTSTLQLAMMIVLCLAMTTLYYFAAKKSGNQWLKKSELYINVTLREILWGICLGTIFTLAVLAYGRFVTGEATSSRISVISFVGAVILGPIIEEWIFRGIFLKSMLTKIGEKNAILISAIVFGLVHAGSSLNPAQIVGAIGLGYYFGYVYVEHRSLTNTIILHSIINGIGLIGMQFLR